MNRTITSVLVCAMCLASAHRASAASPEDRKTAEDLFVQGSSLVNAGRYAEGCPKIESARKLAMGVGIMLYMGECREEAGDLAGAWEEFKKAEELGASKNDLRREVARKRAERLWPRLAKIKIVVSAAADVEGLVITDDGALVERAAWFAERPVGVRTHHIRAVALDGASWEVAIETSANAATVTVDVPVLKTSDVAHALKPTPPAEPAELSPRTNLRPAFVPTRPLPRLTPQRIVGIGVFGAGLVGLTLGTIYGIDAKSKLDDSNASGHCRSDNHCDAAGIAERSNGLGSATISTVSFLVGAGCLAGGAVVYLLAPGRDHAPGIALAVRTEASGAGVTVYGRW